MARRKKIMTEEDVNKLLEERMLEYKLRYTPYIILDHGYTYIGFNVRDTLTIPLMESLIKLIELMRIQYSIKYPFGDDEKYYISIEGEDEDRANFIQKFIDDGYKLNWC